MRWLRRKPKPRAERTLVEQESIEIGIVHPFPTGGEPVAYLFHPEEILKLSIVGIPRNGEYAIDAKVEIKPSRTSLGRLVQPKTDLLQISIEGDLFFSADVRVVSWERLSGVLTIEASWSSDG